MVLKNNNAFTPLFSDKGGPRSGLKVGIGKGGRLTVQRVEVTDEEPDPLTVEEIEALRADAFAEGHAKGTAEAIDAHQQAVAAALDNLSQAIGQMIAAMDEALTQAQRDAVHLAIAMATRLAPALMAREPRAEIEALVEQCLSSVKNEPQIVVHVAAELVDDLRAPLEAQAVRRGFTGRLVMAVDNDLSGSDVRVVWGGGGAERDSADVIRAIEDLVSRYVDGAPAEAAAPTH